MVHVVQGLPADTQTVSDLAEDIFSDYGDYGRILSKFYSSQGVHSFLARDGLPSQPGGPVIGFAILGFLPWSGGSEDDDWWIADLLALAVVSQRRRQGVGRKLLEQVAELVTKMSEWRDIKECQLTCAADNQAALDYFQALGFDVVNRNHGVYSSGQPAWRLAAPLDVFIPKLSSDSDGL